MVDSETKNKNCPLCNQTLCLTQYGILKIYLLAAKLPLFIMGLGVLGGLFYSSYLYLLALLGFIMPLAMADFRLYLYPVAAVAHCFGKKLNCPKCEPQGSMFRHN
jgi:hypothetical protein